MTTIADTVPVVDKKEIKKQYDISRREIYKQRKAELRKLRARKENFATISWKKRRENWSKVLLTNAKHRAKKYGIYFDLKITDIIIPDYCPVLGMKLSVDGGIGYRARDCTPSMDRMDNSLGYISDNIRIISWRANRLKGDATLEEVEKIFQYMKGEVP